MQTGPEEAMSRLPVAVSEYCTPHKSVLLLVEWADIN
jgi:hypothetical protein